MNLEKGKAGTEQEAACSAGPEGHGGWTKEVMKRRQPGRVQRCRIGKFRLLKERGRKKWFYFLIWATHWMVREH